MDRGFITSRTGSASRPASCGRATNWPRPGHAQAIERGRRRQGVSNAFFVYLRDSDGHRIELYSCDCYTGDPDFAPLRWSVNDVRCRSFWGTRVPDSWYEESAGVIGPTGNVVGIEDATVGECDQRSEVML